MNKVIAENIADDRMFTSIDITNQIKRDGCWISNSDVAEYLRSNPNILARFGYISTMIKVDSGGTTWWASLYHNTMSYPDTYLARDQRGISPDQFKDLYEPKPAVKKTIKKGGDKMDVKDIVVVDNGIPITDTKILADTFGKRHSDILRKLETLGVSDEFNGRNFTLVSYLGNNGEQRPMYKMTRSGWTFLVMGFTGKKADAFKEKYIDAFDAMEKYIQEGKVGRIPQTYSEALLLAGEQAAKVEQLELQEKVNAPKVVYHDTVKSVGKGVLIGQFSKVLTPDIVIGPNKLFTLLRNHGILQSKKGKDDPTWNMPYQQYIDQRYFIVDEGTRPSNSEGTKLTYTTKITGKGQIWLTKKLKKILGV